jgi:hypothetical protein
MSAEKNNLFESEGMKMLLEELTGELQTNNKTLDDLVKNINQLSGKVTQVEEKLAKPQPVQVTVNTDRVQKVVNDGIATMKVLAAAKPRALVRKVQILLFPERDAKVFYKVVFGRWFLMLMIMFSLSCLYRFGIHWNDNRKEVKQYQLKNNKIKKAWNYLYLKEGKAIKRLMDSAYIKSGQIN